MKARILMAACVLIALCSNAQIRVHNLYPSATAWEEDTIVSYLTLVTQGSMEKQSSVLSISNDTIFYKSCYPMVNIASEGYVYDTIVIGTLPTGIYHYILQVSRTPGNNDTNCENANIQSRYYDTIINVSKYTGITTVSDKELQVVVLGASKLHLHAPHAGIVSIQVYNAIGQLHHSSSAQVSEGKNEIALDMPNLPSGLYLYHIQLDVQRKVLKYIKQ